MASAPLSIEARQDINEEISRLETLKNELQQLQDSYRYFIQETSPTIPVPALWPDLLGKFNILGAKYLNINQDISQRYFEELSTTVVIPNARLNTDTEYGTMSVLLRTKAIPEIEENELKLRSVAEDRWGKKKGGLSQSNVKEWNDKLELYEIFIGSLNELLKQLHKNIATTSKERGNAIQSISSFQTPHSSAYSQSLNSPGSTQVSQLSGTQDNQSGGEKGPPMESILQFMYSGELGIQ